MTTFVLTTLFSINIHATTSTDLGTLINSHLKLQQRGLNTPSSPIMYVGRDLITSSNESSRSERVLLLG